MPRRDAAAAKAYRQEYYRKNRDRIVARTRAYTLAHKDQHKRSTRKHQLKRYGLTEEQYDTMLSAQDFKCAICRTDQPGGTGTWHVDHCHDTDVVRGILCHQCNTGLGKFKDNPELLDVASVYLRKHK